MINPGCCMAMTTFKNRKNEKKNIVLLKSYMLNINSAQFFLIACTLILKKLITLFPFYQILMVFLKYYLGYRAFDQYSRYFLSYSMI